MQLNRLEIKGFKSFGDKITIHFNEGVTAIVGPNGCGKSNVVDAIRWVLGEQSTRMLRSEKMENIIFNGTKSRKPANLAEVSLSFDNTRNILPTEFSQVTITRKLYRSGESEYRLNDVQCRLKDITDLFLDTGIGADSYSIIELRMIDEIINNKEHSRRALFEEASGISKYKVRKKQTLSKLRDTEADLNRVEDLLFEIEKNLKTLENQAKKTERYYRIREQYKAFSVELARLRIAGFTEVFERLSSNEEQQEIIRAGIAAQTATMEALLQQMKQESLAKEKNLSIQQKATNEYVGNIRAYESDKKIKNQQLRHLEEKERNLVQELSQDKQQLNHILYNLKRLQEEHLTEENRLKTLQVSLSEKRDHTDALRGQQQSTKVKLDTFVKELTELQNNIYKQEKEIAVLHIQRDALAQESRRNVADAESKESELNEFNKLVAQLEEETTSRQQELDTATEQETGLQQQIRQSEQLLQSLKDELGGEGRMLDAKQNEYNLTKSLVDNLEGFPESIRFLRKHSGWAKQAPLFSDVLFCKEEYRVAIENYLEPVMNHYVVEKHSDAILAIHLLNDASRGRVSFFVLEAVEPQEARLMKTEDDRLIPALDVIDVEKKYQKLCELLLRNVFLIRANDESDLASPLPEHPVVLLHKSGKFSKNRLGMSGGSVGLFEGKRIGRAKNLEILAKETKALTQHMHQLQNRMASEAERIDALKSSSRQAYLEEARQQLNRLQHELVTVKTKQEQYIAFIDSSRHRKQDIESKIAGITDELQKAEPLLEVSKAQQIIKEADLRTQQDDFADLSGRLTDQSTVFNEANIQYHQQLNRLSGIDKDLEYRESQRDTLEKRITRNDAELQTVRQDMMETLKHVDHSDEDLLAMYAQKETLEQGLKEMEQAYYTVRGKINETEEAIQQQRRRKEQADVLITGIKEQKTNLKIELNALKERLAVEFSIDIEDLIQANEEVPPAHNDQPEVSPRGMATEEELREKTAKLKKQLDEFGSINPMAMEAYQEMYERHTFICKEKQDLTDAKMSLLKTIKEIDDTAREKFMNSFNQVRENFIQVFRSLFNEEDTCDLLLTDPTNPLEADIDIVARPKGKRPLSINQLSGGEKTLTATALLFSLYLLKPAPFCIFDEVDAPLDDTNIDKFNTIIRKFSDQSQFIIVSHNKRTIASTDIIYGVTMVEQGVSRVVAVDMREVG